ncbi:Putative membrane protein [Moritella viscosa]|uniref:Putative membrane protein n=1 Tax=Moritella viscosa TaxID=80854 RepID=A0A090K4X9_9GAMM|nr:membrane protein [Moritella viscosa]CED58818.1 membrane protein [Moritella viscosa]SGY84451.1 Putative membrane protein [Moritella viscosa]SGY84546.1 Putative membrane protein [Moritella viscosa]SGY85269.1 Putative membrane protein [Moritella viscosa]SHN98002.1 Putative membrane protein [Moritella viscosa]
MHYGLLVGLHLLCATIFIGVVAFEVLILEGIRQHLPAKTMSLVEQGIHLRGRKIMPFIVATLFITGGFMGYHHLSPLPSPFATSFSTLLTIKIILAVSVLIHFILAMKHSVCGDMTTKIFKYTHLSVFFHMLAIIFLAKGMFYIQW